LTKGFVHEFGECVKLSTDVWIASAWVTKSEALNDLLESGCRVRALVGTHGNATDPEAIELLITDHDCDVRLVERGAMFHPKLYLFRRRGARTVAWIGSANFTGGGFAGNRELILKLDDEEPISEMETWFKEQWRACRDQDVETALEDYRERRVQESVAPYLRLMVEAPAEEGLRDLGDLRNRAKYRFKYFGEDRWAPYHAELARSVLLAFAEVDPGFLERFAQKDKERVKAPGMKRRYLSRNRDDLGKPRTLPKKPLTKDGKWWMGQNLADYHFYQGKTHPGILMMACDTFGVANGEGDVGPIGFGSPGAARPPRGYDTGEKVVVKIGQKAERHALG